MPIEDFPLVSIITPCFNMAGFIEQTVVSVLSQDYPHIEYIVVDGASTDRTLEILRAYEAKVKVISRPDSGPAEAINRGFSVSSGSIVSWLNADDTYLPGAISTAVKVLKARPEAGGIYGDGYWTDVHGRFLGAYPTRDFDPQLLARECFICQPACFLRRELIQSLDMLNPGLQYSFDYDLWIRAAAVSRFEHIPIPLATSRMHSGTLTLGKRRQILRESMTILAQHYGYVPFNWIHSYCVHLLDRRDQFFDPLRPTFLKYVVSLPVGCWHNRTALKRYWREWRSVMSPQAFVRMCTYTITRPCSDRRPDGSGPPAL